MKIRSIVIILILVFVAVISALLLFMSQSSYATLTKENDDFSLGKVIATGTKEINNLVSRGILRRNEFQPTNWKTEWKLQGSPIILFGQGQKVILRKTINNNPVLMYDIVKEKINYHHIPIILTVSGSRLRGLVTDLASRLVHQSWITPDQKNNTANSVAIPPPAYFPAGQASGQSDHTEEPPAYEEPPSYEKTPSLGHIS